jgi:hypothetical protein
MGSGGEGGGRGGDIATAASVASSERVERGVGGRQYALNAPGDDCDVQTCVHGVDPFFIFLSIYIVLHLVLSPSQVL